MRDEQRLPKGLPLTVRKWEQKLRVRHASMRPGRKVTDEHYHRLAALLSLLGPVEDPGVTPVFFALTSLLFHPIRITRLRPALDLLPPSSQALRRVQECCHAWATVTKRSLAKERCQVDQVIRVMLQVPAPKPYVRHLASRGIVTLGAVFHPNTLTRAKAELRGIFSGTEGEDGYWARTREQLRVVEDPKE